MSTPSYEQLLQGGTRWVEEHHSITYRLSHHGHRPHPTGDTPAYLEHHPGIWCFYLIVNSLQYPDFDDWAVRTSDIGYDEAGPNWDDDWFWSGITFAERGDFRTTPRFGHSGDFTPEVIQTATVGCDYNHSWDQERGYPDTLESVRADAQRACDQLIGRFPKIRLHCRYSGVWDEADQFYEANNGATVHVSQEEKLKTEAAKKGGGNHWLRKPPPQIEPPKELPKLTIVPRRDDQ